MGFETHGGGISGVPALCRELADRVASPFFGVLYDPCNLMQAGTDYRLALWIMRDHIVHVHLKDGAVTSAGFARTMMGEGQIDFAWIVQQLDALGLSPHRKTLVIVTSGSFERWMRPYVDVKAHLASIEAVIRYVMQQPDVQLIIKTHPRRDYPVVYAEMVSQLGEDNDHSEKVRIITEADLFDILAVADVIIVPSTHTTASLEALVAEQPIVYLATARIYDKGFSWVRYGGCLVVNALEDIPPSLDRVLGDTALRERLIAEGRKLLKRYYQAEGTESVSRIQELLVNN